MKKFLFLLSFLILIISNSNAQFGVKKEKKENSNIQEEDTAGKKKSDIVLEPYKPTGVASVDNLGDNSYKLAKSTDSLKKEAAFLQIETTEKQDPKLGTVTEVKCKDGSGKEIPCQGVDKQESLRKFTSILSSLELIATAVPKFTALVPQATSEVNSMKTNPMKAVAAVKALTRITDVGKQLAATGVNVADIIKNIKASVKALDLIKKQ